MEFHRVTRAALVDPKTPDEAVDQTVHILTVTRKDDADTTPLQFVSAARLAHLLKLEAAAAALAALIEKAPREIAEPQQP